MSAGDLPPMEGDTAQSEPVCLATSPAIGRGGGEQGRTGAHQVEASQFTHESKLPPLRLDDHKPRLAKGPTVIALAGLGSAVALATAFAFSPSPAPQKAAEGRSDQPPVTQAVQLPDVIEDPPAAASPDAGLGSGSLGSVPPRQQWRGLASRRVRGGAGRRPSTAARDAAGGAGESAQRVTLREYR